MYQFLPHSLRNKLLSLKDMVMYGEGEGNMGTNTGHTHRRAEKQWLFGLYRKTVSILCSFNYLKYFT